MMEKKKKVFEGEKYKRTNGKIWKALCNWYWKRSERKARQVLRTETASCELSGEIFHGEMNGGMEKIDTKLENYFTSTNDPTWYILIIIYVSTV